MKTLRTLTAVGLAAAFCVAAVEAASAAPVFVQPAVKVQSDVIQVRDRYWRGGWNGNRGYRYYGGYHNDDWWFPAGAFVAGALIGGAIANSNSYGGYYGDRYYGDRYYGDGYRYYPRTYYPERVYVAPRRSAYRQGYRDGYRAGYDEGAYGGYRRCSPRLADMGNC